MSIKRVLHIVGKMDRAGAETMLMNLYRQIDHSQIQFDFVTFTYRISDYDAEIKALGGRIVPIIAHNPIERMLKLKQLLQQNPEYRIVHAHMLLSNAFHLLAAKNAGVQHRISHAHSTSNGKSGLINKVYEKWALRTNRKVATHKIACSESAAQYLFGSSDKVWLLPNAVNIEKMLQIAKDSRSYIDTKLSNNGLKIIQIGRLSTVKNHQFSIELAELLQKRQVDFTMYIVGQGPLENELKQQVQDEVLSDKIKFLGVRTDVAELMSSADYMIMPSLHEGFPVVLVESQAVGLMSIVSDRISTEVDLGLGLVEFLPISSANAWAKRLQQPKHLRPTEKEIDEALKLYSFDAATNAHKLTKMYMSL